VDRIEKEGGASERENEKGEGASERENEKEEGIEDGGRGGREKERESKDREWGGADKRRAIQGQHTRSESETGDKRR
jgi:hypothetical protein